MNKVYLIGLPASGKTTTAKWLAEKMGWTAVDLDELIEIDQGNSISGIFDQLGEDEFRKIEAKVLRDTKKLNFTVISCGGGTAAFHNNMDWMISNGMTIYLNTDLNTILSRIQKNNAVRPLFSGLSEAEIQEKLSVFLQERGVYYSKSKLVWNKEVPTEMLHFAVNQLIAS